MKRKLLIYSGTLLLSVALLVGCNGEINDPIEEPPMDEPAGEQDTDEGL